MEYISSVNNSQKVKRRNFNYDEVMLYIWEYIKGLFGSESEVLNITSVPYGPYFISNTIADKASVVTGIVLAIN